MFQISRDTPAYFLTSVTHNRLPIFRTPTLAKVLCDALAEARRSGGFRLFAYVIMPDHTHYLTDSSREIKDVLRFLNGVSARRVINYLKESGQNASLENFESPNVETSKNIPSISTIRTRRGSPGKTRLCKK